MSLLEKYKKKFLGFMLPDQINEVVVTDKGFVYKGNLIVAIPGLSAEVAKTIETVEKIEPIIEQVEEIEKIEEKISEVEVEKVPVKKVVRKKK